MENKKKGGAMMRRHDGDGGPGHPTAVVALKAVLSHLNIMKYA
jgi:hypothetical protein